MHCDFKDYEVDIHQQLEKIPDEVKVDVKEYLKTINRHHRNPRTYTTPLDVRNKLIEFKVELNDIDRQSNHGYIFCFFSCNQNQSHDYSRKEVSGMTKKSFTILLKLSMVFCAAREALEFMETGDDVNEKKPGVKFELTLQDVHAAWDLVKFSMNAYKCFKVTN